jgi:hypothetical protein
MFQFQSRYVILLVLLVLVVCTILVRFQSNLYMYIVLVVASIIVLNITLIVPSELKYRGLLITYCSYTLLSIQITSILGISNLLGVFEYLVDVVYIVLVLLVLTLYHSNRDLCEVLTIYTPLFLLISVILGLYVGLKYPLRYALLVLLDTFTAIIVISSEKNPIIGFIISLLFFIILYITPIIILNTIMFIIVFSMYVARAILILYKRIINLRTLLLLDILLRPLLVSYL